MIYKEQFDKILKFIDSGIIIPQDSYLNSINSIEAIINFDDYTLNIIFGTTANSYQKIKLSQNLENDILEMNTLLLELGEKESRRIGKNSYTFNWDIEILDYEITTEDISILKITNKNLNNEIGLNRIFKKEEVDDKSFEVYLNHSFTKLFNELLSPNKGISPDLFDYQQIFNNNTSNNLAYNNLIKNTNIKISYRISIYVIKDEKEVTK